MVEPVRISVAVVTYNGADYIEEQLDSILKQLTGEDEVIISDDGSNDGTRKIIEAYQQREPRIRLLEGPQKGIKKNVEHAIAHCRGSYIYLADQDDIWLEDKVEKVQKAFSKTESLVVIHDARVFAESPGSDKKPEIIMESFFAFRQAGAGVLKNIWKNSYIGCCMAFRKELKEKIIPIPEQIEMHDQWIGILNDFYHADSCFLREPLLLYRRHGDNNSGMTHYGVCRMLRNRIIFLYYFFRRILHIG